jgi:hypothetical protein
VSPQDRTTYWIEIRFVKFHLKSCPNPEELLQAPEVESTQFYEPVTNPKHGEIESEVGRNKEKVQRKGRVFR